MVDIAKGKYERVSEENYDELVAAFDVNYRLRAKGIAYETLYMEVTEEGGVWTIETSTILNTAELKFRVGEKFEETTLDGREVSGLVNVDGNKIIVVETAKKEGEKSTKSIREFTDDGCICTTEILGSDIVCVQKFKRL